MNKTILASEKTPTVLAIDPGQYGACVGIYPDGEVEIEVMPLTKNKTIDCVRVGEFVDQLSHNDIVIVCEKVHSMPAQGVASTFKFGKNTGMVLGAAISRASGNAVLAEVKEVAPQTWKKHHGLTGKPKSAAIDLLKEKLPQHDWGVFTKKALEGVADAYLIGLWYLETSTQ